MTLEQLLVQTQLLSPMQLAVAQRDAQLRHRRLAPTLIDLGMIDEKRFADWMVEVTHLPLVDPLPDADVVALQRRVPRALAREYEVVPLRLTGQELTVATINPLESAALSVLHTTTGLQIRAVVARYGELMRLVTKCYPEDEVEPTMLPLPLFTRPVGDESPGISTQIVHAVTPETQLDRIEKRLDRLEERINAIDALIARVIQDR